MSPDPKTVERTVKRSRIAEAVAVLTVVAAMLGAVATMASNMETAVADNLAQILGFATGGG